MGRKFYHLVHGAFSPVLSLLWLKKATGLENLPKEGGYVLCVNHLSALDPFCVASRLPRSRNISFLAKKELFENKLLKILVEALGAIPVDRGNADLNAVRTSLKVLKDGDVLMIFPQGTRSKDNTPTPMLGGASMIALRGDVPVIPCYIDGPYRMFRRVDIRFGKPLDLSAFGRRCDADTLSRVTAMIESGIWGLRDA